MIYLLSKPLTKSLNCVNKAKLHKRSHFVYTRIAKANKRIILEGDIPSPIDPPPGCRFKGRCRYAKAICGQEEPKMKELEKGHFVACHLF